MDAATQNLIKDVRPGLKHAIRADPGPASRILLVVLALLVGNVAMGVWGARQGGAGWGLLALAMALMGPLHHHLGVLHHEAIHGLLYRTRWLNDLFLYLLAGGVGAPPATSRIAHFSHHAYLGDARDLEQPNYVNPPQGRRAFVLWVLGRLSGLEAAGRFLYLLTTITVKPAVKAPEGETSHARARYTTPLSDWIALAVVQSGLLAIFTLTVGWQYYVALWLVPLFTVSRTIIGLRALMEHLRDQEVIRSGRHRLMTFDSGLIERLVFGPLYFHYHAEHHLFPRIPVWRLPEIKDAVRAHPDFPALVRRYPSYWTAVRAYLAAS